MPHKSERTIIRTGNSLAVTIPLDWARYYGLTNKDKVTVISNGKIIIQPKERKQR